MAVPNTNSFSQKDVADEIGVSYSGRTLTSLFQLATGTFDPAYVGSKNSLYNFRNYSHISVVSISEVRDITHIRPYTQLFITPTGNRIFFMDPDNDDLVSYDLGTPFSITSGFTNRRVTKKPEFGQNDNSFPTHINFSNDGRHMYYTKMGTGFIVDNEVWEYSLNTPFRPDINSSFLRTWNTYEYSSNTWIYGNKFFISDNGSMSIMTYFTAQGQHDVYDYSTLAYLQLSPAYSIANPQRNLTSSTISHPNVTFKDNLLFIAYLSNGKLIIQLRTYNTDWNILSGYTTQTKEIYNENKTSPLNIPSGYQITGLHYPRHGDDLYILLRSGSGSSYTHRLYRIKLSGNGIL